jgi:hypothetical protein
MNKKQQRQKKKKKARERFKMQVEKIEDDAPKTREIDLSNPIDIYALLLNEFGGCGCSEDDEMAKVIVKILEWAVKSIGNRVRYNKLFRHVGTFYIVAGILDNNDLLEHGTSIRCAWATKKGKMLLETLKEMDFSKKIEGTAYDGCFYEEGYED